MPRGSAIPPTRRRVVLRRDLAFVQVMGRASYAASSLAPMPPEHILEDELRAEVRQRQHAEAAQSPTYRGAPAPAETDAARQQHAEYRPSDQRQHRLVNQMLCGHT